MATSYSPNTITNGLILAIDAGDTNCFVSGDTTCTNLITGNTITGANGEPGSGTHTPNTANFPAYNAINGGVFDFNGAKGMNCDEDLGTATESSICMWFYKNSSAIQYFTDARNNGGQWFLSNYTEDNINWTEQLTYNFSGTYDASDSAFLNQWIHMVATSNSSESKLYLNGQLVTGGNRASTDEDFGKNFRIGTRYTTSAEWTGYMGPIYLYNRALSAQEALEVFNAHKIRFGK